MTTIECRYIMTPEEDPTECDGTLTFDCYREEYDGSGRMGIVAEFVSRTCGDLHPISLTEHEMRDLEERAVGAYEHGCDADSQEPDRDALESRMG